MSREREISGSEAVRLYTERMCERQDGPTAALRRNMQEADERIAAAERECDQLRALLGHAAEMLYVICEYASVDTRTLDGADLTARPDIHRTASDLIDRITASGLLDDEGQQP